MTICHLLHDPLCFLWLLDLSSKVVAKGGRAAASKGGSSSQSQDADTVVLTVTIADVDVPTNLPFARPPRAVDDGWREKLISFGSPTEKKRRRSRSQASSARQTAARWKEGGISSAEPSSPSSPDSTLRRGMWRTFYISLTTVRSISLEVVTLQRL